MRRLLAVVLGGVLVPATVVGARPVGAAAERGGGPRSATVAYAPNPQQRIVIDPGAVTGSPGTSVASVEVMARTGERALMVSATDDSGYPARVDVDQGRSTLGWFCGASKKPVRITGGEPVTIEVFSGLCDGALGVATRGTVKVTFFRRAAGS